MDSIRQKTRWEIAQRFEAGEWKSHPGVFENEYEESRRKYKSFFEKLVSELSIQKSWKILDVGCNATCVSSMIEKGSHYGIDPLADELHIQERVPNFEIKNAMGEEIPYTEKNFELVVCVNVIGHTENPKKVIEEMKRVTTKNGYLVISVYTYNNFICLMRRIAEKIPSLRNVGHPHTFSQKSFEKLVGSYFKIISSTVIHEGKDPTDFGKVGKPINEPSPIQALVSFINSKILGYKWFVREYCLVCERTN